MPDAAQTHHSPATWTPGPADPWPLRREQTVLVVDSNEDVRNLYRDCLEVIGYQVEEAADGHSAIAMVRRRRPDVIVLDAADDQEAAARWAQRLKGNPETHDIPLLAIVGEDAELPTPGRLESAVDDCLVKPTRHWELVLRVRSMMRLSQHRLELLEGRSLHGEQTRMWGVLLDFTRRVPRLQMLETLFDQIVQSAAEMTCSRRVSLMLPDDQEQFLTIARCIGLDEAIARDVRVPIGEAISGQAYRTGRPVTTLEDQRFANRKGFDFRSFVSMPLIYTTRHMVHQRVGVLNVSDRYGDLPFEEWELEFINLLASIAGSAIDDIHSRDTRESLLRIERDLQVARRIQRNTFPRELPALRGFEIHAWSEPAEETAGDTYDVIGCVTGPAGDPVHHVQDASRAYLLLADATGHGIGPALSVTQVRAMLRMAVRMQSELPRIARHLNEQLCVDLPGGRFVTAWLGELCTKTGTVTSFSAGQAPILRYEAARDRFEVLSADTMPLGISATLDISIGAPIRMEPGDILAVISDGVFEARNRAGKPFGTERVMDVIASHRSEPSQQIQLALREAIAKFTEGAPAADDRTAIVVKRTAE